LFLHEAVPGHHLQIARGQEITALPPLRRRGGNAALQRLLGGRAELMGNQVSVPGPALKYLRPWRWPA